ncbi:glutamate racemase [Nicoletella semolina]|uniref:Glutamate racemase n=1 Tax=Nicoletella semolina TaxID=271160 RepID=A0A4R2N588_9PAST|nr:glutamate racemase [Nicoletella semolina]MDH2924793.1 glutamate racemase [Nicoletella semolina]TCP16012.1 glutamate racemase [Nicoletella semolina]
MKPTILLYDSGMGGLTVYSSIRQLLPDAHYLYCFDNAYFPYSEKSEGVLVERAVQIVQKIAKNYPIDLVVVACNTASTVVLNALRGEFDFPIVGTVPAIKPASVLSQTRVIGLLATKGTIARPYVDQLIEQYASDCQIEKIGTTELVELVEEKILKDRVDKEQLAKIVAPWQANSMMDTVILGCTHFPLVKNELQLLLPQVKYFIDSGNGIANRVFHLLSGRERNLLDCYEEKNKKKENVAFCTWGLADEQQRKKIMQDWGFQALLVIE